MTCSCFLADVEDYVLCCSNNVSWNVSQFIVLNASQPTAAAALCRILHIHWTLHWRDYTICYHTLHTYIHFTEPEFQKNVALGDDNVKITI